MTTKDTFENDDDMVAAEYVLGLLTGDDLAEAKRRLAEDAGFIQLVTDWEMRLATLTDEVEPVAPPASVKLAVMKRVTPEAPKQSVWQKLWIWQAVSVASVLLLAVVMFADLPDQQGQVGPLYTAEIVSDAGDFRVVAVVDKTTNEVTLTRTAGAAPAGRILQVWAHGPGEPAESVGLWPNGDTIRLAMPANIASVDDILTIGVSEEPPGGSPTGLPSGRVFGTVDIPII